MRFSLFANAVVAMLVGAGPTVAQTFPITVANNCESALLVRGRSKAGALIDVTLQASAKAIYNVALPFVSGNIFGCWNAAAAKLGSSDVWDMEKYCGMVEMTVNADSNGNPTGPNVDISYVDILTMPMRIELTGAVGCNAGGTAVSADKCFQKTKAFTLTTAQSQCPTTTENGTVGCWGAAKYCDPGQYAAPGGDPSGPFCKALDTKVENCSVKNPTCKPTPTDLKYPSFAVYGCTGFFATPIGKEFCGRINRGTLDMKDADEPKNFYTTPPFNTYTQHVHQVAGALYAFPYDDVGNQSGDVGAATASGITVTYCPG
jgi:hypothetical protein